MSESFRSSLTSKVQEDLEDGRSVAVVELETASGDAIEMAGLLDGEDGGQLRPANVHVERFRLDVEEFAPGTEAAEFAKGLQGGAGVRDDHVDPAERLEAAEQLF